MKKLQTLYERIVQRVNINLRELAFDVSPFAEGLISLDQLVKFYAFYGISQNHALNFQFRNSSLAGSYFLGKCRVSNSILYKTDVRGDELKKAGIDFKYLDTHIPVTVDEEIHIENSMLIKTLVHCYSHDPETLEQFFISDTVSTHYANIHGSPMDGSALGPFATVDLTTTRDCVIGTYSYVQAGEIGHLNIEPGTVWVRKPDVFNFFYRYPSNRLAPYIFFAAGNPPKGLLMDFLEERKTAFESIFNVVNIEPVIEVPASASLDRYAVVDPHTHIDENVLVAQRAFLQNARLGKGANAQENCYIINSRLEGFNVTAHGAKIIEAELGKYTFVGFNSFLRGRPDKRLTIGGESIIMPHTIIDAREPLAIPPGHLIWGLITTSKELETNSISLEELSRVSEGFCKGEMLFEGSGAKFVAGFRDRIQHILDSNGAFFDGLQNQGHAQLNQNISFNTIQPYPEGELEGLYPTISIQP